LARLLRLGVACVIGFLGLLAADSIYHEPQRLRLAVLVAAAIALGAGLVWVISSRWAGAFPQALDRSWAVHRALIAILLAVFLAGSAAVRPGYMTGELQRILLPWREFRTRAEVDAQQLQDRREAEKEDLLDTDPPGQQGPPRPTRGPSPATQ